MRAFLSIVLAIFCVSCSKADVNKTTADLKTAASHVKNDPAVKELGSDIKEAAKDTGQTLKKAGANAKEGLQKAGADIKQSAEKTKQEVKSDTDSKDKREG